MTDDPYVPYDDDAPRCADDHGGRCDAEPWRCVDGWGSVYRPDDSRPERLRCWRRCASPPAIGDDVIPFLVA